MRGLRKINQKVGEFGCFKGIHAKAQPGRILTTNLVELTPFKI